MRVLKFGGSSVANAERIQAVARIVAAARERGPVVVVVSALGGVTDRLLDAAKRAAAGDAGYRAAQDEIVGRHREALATLATAAELPALAARLEAALGELGELLHGASLVREASPRTLDSVASYGERLSAMLVAAAFRAQGMPAVDVDARRFLLTDGRFGAARVDRAASDDSMRAWWAGAGETLPVVTGFIAATAAGETTTLGRGGSDYTASLLGAALGAEVVEIWTDVSGVLEADPRIVPAARPIAELSYVELMEMSHFGAKVVHPPSVHPTRAQGIPLLIKNTFDPAAPGTLVQDARPSQGGPVCGIASVPRIALLRLEGDGMVGVPGIAGRLFGTLARRGVNVILITQASSEHSISLGVAPGDLGAATEAIAEEFTLERRLGLIDELVVEDGQAVVAVVGRGMRENVGLAGRIFAVLGEHGINVRAIAQGSSELNISLVVAGADEARAIRALHEACFHAGRRTVEIYLAGAGRVGRALLAQIAAQAPELAREQGLHLVLAGLASSRRELVDPRGLEPATAAASLDQAPAAGEAGTAREPAGLEALLAAAEASPSRERIFVDCSASEVVAASHDRMLAAGLAVVTANKVRLAGPLAGWRTLRAARPGKLFHEATIGAGLPVVSTLRDLLATGDKVERIEGLFSGTLGFLTDRLHAGELFSRAVHEAHERGYTEPDPREDLSGRDVARKLLILARLAGWELEPEEVEVEPWVPDEPWSQLALPELWPALAALDDAFASRVSAARTAGRRLVYLARLDRAGAAVKLEALPADHPAAGVRGSDNLIAFSTDRYRDNPLIVRGPGAGPEVTAGGVFADLLRAVAESAGRRSLLS